MLSRLFFLVIFSAGAFAGEAGYQFLRVGLSPRASALGNGFTAQSGDVSTFFYNPAGLATLESRQVEAGYMNHILDINSGYVAIAERFEKWGGTYGAGLTYFNYGEFKGFDALGNSTSSYSSTDFSISVFHARSIDEHWSVGASSKFIYSSIQNFSSTAIALDLGVQYHLTEQNMTCGASLLNSGFVTSSYRSHADALPLSLQFGISKKLEKAPIEISLNFSDLNRPGRPILARSKRFIIGAEWVPQKDMTIRFGYNNQRHQELNLATTRGEGVSAGLGFRHEKYIFEYAFTSWGIGTLNAFSIRYNL